MSFSSAADSAMCFPFTLMTLKIGAWIVFQICRSDGGDRKWQFAIFRREDDCLAAQPDDRAAMRFVAGDFE